MSQQVRKKPLSLPDESELRLMVVEQGMTDGEIAAAKGCTSRTVRSSRKRFGIPPAVRGRKPIEKTEGAA